MREKIMKVFEDLDFNPTDMPNGIQGRMSFNNGYGVSVVRSDYTYGGDKGLYELAVLNDSGGLCYDTEVTDDVLGYLTEEEVSDAMGRVQNLK